MNELWLGLAIGFAGASFSWMLVKPLMKIDWLYIQFIGKDNSLLYVWVQRAIAVVFTILWWL